MLTRLPDTPARPVAPQGRLLEGLTRGALGADPLAVGPRTGRARRWSYAAGADGDAAIGAAIVDLGFAATAFVWLLQGTRCSTWERRFPGGRGVRVGDRPELGATAAVGARRAAASVRITGRGGLHVDVPAPEGRIRANLEGGAGVPAALITRTPAGGWNGTQRRAGYPFEGTVRVSGGPEQPLSGGGWSDWTAGRQDRRTSWRWAAGAGRAADGRRVGLNVGSGMNGAGPGENLVWWDGEPFGLGAVDLVPTAGARGPWTLRGPGWSLDFEPVAVRAATERLLVVSSDYTQPIGAFRGRLPDPSGALVEVQLRGVTEEHTARW